MLHHRTILLVSALALGVALSSPAAAATASLGRTSTSSPSPKASKAAHTPAHRPGIASSADPATLAQKLIAAGKSAPVVTGPETVVLALTPRNFALLAATAAAAKTLAPGVRNAQREAAIAGPARAALVAGAAHRLGLTVVSTSDMTVTVTGSGALVHQLFGSSRDTNPSSAVAQPLPRIPATLAPYVTEAGGGDDTRPAQLPMISQASTDTAQVPALTVSQLRSMYNVPADSSPPTASSPTIATLQFSNWYYGDLKSYIDASNNDIYATNAYNNATLATDFTADDVLPISQDDIDGSSEVALDQETLASVAPQLRQRAYFAPDDNVDGEYAELDTIAQQAATYHIVAVSTSWGLCEPESYTEWFNHQNDPLLTMDEVAVYNVLASGVTMFAASGDSGASDCDYTQPNSGECNSGPADLSATDDFVDTPASFPGVIAVGGTIGTNVTDLNSWDAGPCSASGGGFSCMFLLPSYQEGTDNVPPGPYGANYQCYEKNNGATISARGVPDIAADAGDGLDVYDSYTEGCASTPCQFGGTSLAVQIAAGSWAQSLVDQGFITKGAGDISTALYSAQLKSSINDVVHGSDGGTTYEYRTNAGWDPVTGLGSPEFASMAAKIATSYAGPSDIYLVQANGTRSGNVELSALSTSDSFHGFSANATTGLKITDPSEWQFEVGPYNGDNKRDLYAIQTSGTNSGMVEVSVLSQASNYSSFLLTAQPTGLAAVTAAQWQFRIAGYGDDNASDLYAIRVAGATNTQIYAFSAASDYTTRIVARDIPLGPEPTGWTFLVDNIGNLYAIQGTSKNVALYEMPAASSYHAFTLKVLTPLSGGTNPDVSYTMGDVNGDGVPDLSQTNTSTTQTEVLTVNGATAYHSYLSARVTPLGPLNSTNWVTAEQP